MRLERFNTTLSSMSTRNFKKTEIVKVKGHLKLRKEKLILHIRQMMEQTFHRNPK